MAFTFNDDSLKRGKVSPEECLEALADPFKTYYDDLPSERGNPRRMWVGYTLAERRLEVGVEYMINNIEHIYHARKLKGKPLTRRYTVNKEELKKRSKKMTQEAQLAVAQRGIMQFRAEPEDILALYNLAVKRNQRVSTMIREWVIERLEQERGNAPVKLDITINKEKVGSVSLASAILNTFKDRAQLHK